MKKKIYFFIKLLSLSLLSLSVLYSCVGNSPETDRLNVSTVYFHDNYQGIYEKLVVEAGETITLPDEPSRVGYTFEGWMLSADSDATDTFDHLQAINEDITVYAKWNRDNTVSLVTLKFLNYSTADETVAITKGSVFSEPTEPVYDEYETYAFVDWYTDIDLTEAYDFSQEVDDDLVLYAGWIQQKAHIKLDYNFTASPDPMTTVVILGETVSQIDAPTRDQYEFVGWYTERVGGLPFDLDSPIDTDMTIYAHWSRNAYIVTFNTNLASLTDGIDLSYEISRNTSAETQADAIENAMTFEGHEFAGWYLVQTDPNSDEPLEEEYLADLTSINDDMLVYAAWTLEEFQVTFNYNYDDAPANPDSQTVKYTRFIQQPTITDREGYIFGGWFTEPEGINQFTLDDTPVTTDVTLYAKWIDENAGLDKVTVSYVYNIGAGNVAYTSVEVDFNGTVGTNAPQNPTDDDYLFAGWYRDIAFTTKFSNSMNLTEDITVYAKMLKKYTFEAESIDLTDMRGQGTSTNSYEEELLMDYTFVGDGSNTGDSFVSGDFFIRELYYYGALINFTITAEADVDDAVLYIRASSESYEFFDAKPKEEGGEIYNFISDTNFKIIVNGQWSDGEPLTWLDYGGLYLPMANLDEKEDLASHKTPFEDLFVIDGLSLHQGANYITFFVSNNNNHGGTFHAEAPIIDCIYLYSSVELTAHDYEFYLLDGVKRG